MSQTSRNSTQFNATEHIGAYPRLRRFILIQVVFCLASKRSTAESGKPNLDFEMGYELANQLENEITAEGLYYTEEQVPNVMTCAGGV